jgi:hypothetical protein
MGLAASSQYVFQMVNLAGTIYTTGGAIAKAGFSLEDFWFADVRSMSDPQIVYDARSGHWFASIIIIVNHVRFAVSATSNPLGIWYIYQVSAPGTNLHPSVLPDQPFIGYSDDKFLISANDFAYDPTLPGGLGAFIGAQYWIINKAQMIAGAFAPAVQTNTPTPVNTPAGSEDFRIDPMQQLSAGNNAFMAENCEVFGGTFCPEFGPSTTNGGITVFTVTGLPPTATITRVTVPAALTDTPRSADQPGHPASLATNDERMVSAVWNMGRIWTTLNDGGPQCPTASCVRLDEIATPTTPTSILQDFDFTFNGAATFYGAVSTDAANNLVVMFETSSSTMYPSLMVTGQLSNAAPGTLAPSRTVQLGSASDLTTRWGDYYYATTQPGAASTFWVSGGYRTIELFQGWQTRIGQITFSGPGVPPPPPPPPPCQESDGNGDFQGQQKGNFNFDNDGCKDGDQDQVSSSDRGDGRDFKSTQINSVQFDSVTHAISISGVGVSKGVTVGFTLVALETGPTTPGWVSLSFSDGYVNSGYLLNGNILLH